ncbi:hypothetical protein K6V98_01030 [Collinsella sp. AGMB00827]|uniref:Gram-positive cocci surface proteins LPxTG domain-containing protein n=1 Tax=Collinsella ureilytica TaxID=2869515 RepID=A0ABS7MI40_9ACTN|nr:Rib/alpha-like domain-containing protein [Collinsella urealyticum]MBY4796952.1 hypothetical protein [Collinsella urealyticum]
MTEDSSKPIASTKSRWVRVGRTGALAVVLGLGLAGTLSTAPAIAAAEGVSVRSLDTSAHYIANGFESSSLRYANTVYKGVNDNGTIALTITKWSDLATDWGTRQDNEFAGKYILSFSDDGFYKQIESIQLAGNSKASLKKYNDGAMWTLEANGANLQTGVIGAVTNVDLTITLKNGATLNSLGLSDTKLGFESVWIKYSGAIANESISTGFILQNNAKTGGEKKTGFTSGQVANNILVDSTNRRINSIHTFKPDQNFLQSDYAWVVYIREQIPAELVPFIDLNGTKIYSSDIEGKLTPNQKEFDVQFRPDGTVDTSRDAELSIAVDGDNLTMKRLDEVRNNLDNIFTGVLGQSRSYTISYKLKDNVSLADFSSGVLKILKERQQPLFFESSLAADYQNKYISGGLIGKQDDGRPPQQLVNSYANAYLPAADSDKDGIFDFVEYAIGYNAHAVDTDGDGVPDPQEFYTDKTDGKDPQSYKVQPPTTKVEHISRAAEVTLAGTMPKPLITDPSDNSKKLDITNRDAGNALVKLVQADESGQPVHGASAYATATIPFEKLQTGDFTLTIPKGTIPADVKKVVLVGADPAGGEEAVGSVLDVKTDAEIYQAEGQTIETPVNGHPEARSAISNTVGLPDGTVYSWKNGDPDTSQEGTIDATVVVTYPDTSTQEVDVKVKVANNKTDSQRYLPKGGMVNKGFGETVTKDDLAAAVTFEPALPENYLIKGIALKDNAQIPTMGQNNKVVLTVTYADDSTADVEVTLNYGKAADALTPTAAPVSKGFGETATLDDIKGAITVDPADAVEGIELAPGTQIPTKGKDNQVSAVVKYKDGSSDTVMVPVSYQTAAEKYEPVAEGLSKKPGENVALDELQRLVTFKPELVDAHDVKSIELAPGNTLPTPNEDKNVTLTVTYSDGSTDTVTIPVVFGSMNERYTPEGQPVKATMGGELPAAITGIKNTQEMPDGTTYRWKSPAPSTAAAGETNAVIEVVYPDQTIDEVSVKVTVTDERPDALKYDATATKIEAAYGQKLTVDDLRQHVTITPTPAEGVVVDMALPEGVTIPTTGKDVAAPLVVTYSDGTQDVVSVPISFATGAETFNPAANDSIETPMGVVPGASDAIRNKEDLPEGTTYTWTQEPDVSAPAENVAGTVKVTYPDGSSEEVAVKVNVTDTRTDSQKYTATGGVLEVAYGTQVTEGNLAKKVSVADAAGQPAPEGAVKSIKLADGVSIPSNGKGLKVSMTVTYADDSTAAVEVTLTYGDANAAYDPKPQEIVTTPGSLPVAADGIKDKETLPAGTVYEWKDGQVPSTARPGTETGTVLVTYPDNTTDEVQVSVTTKALADVNEPKGRDVKVPLNGELPEAAGAISNMNELPANTQVAWKDPRPDTSRAGEQDATVTVTYPDGSSEDVSIKVKVGTDADAIDPQGQDVTVGDDGKLPKPANGIKNLDVLPDGTDLEWKDPKPNTSRPGTQTGTILVTYPDGSTDEVMVNVVVPKKSGGDSGQDDLSGKSGKSDKPGKSGKLGKFGKSGKGALPQTGDASVLAAGSALGSGVLASVFGGILAAVKRRRSSKK